MTERLDTDRLRAHVKHARPGHYALVLTEDVAALLAENERMREALAFYADPTTYFGIGILADPLTGGFDEDIDEVPWPDGGTNWKPGKLARAALAAVSRPAHTEEGEA